MQTSREPGHRLVSIDAVRGSIMVVMALDHVRDFVHRTAMSSSPTDLARTTPILFFTRWITHFCAPGFMFTAGIGAFLWWQRGRTKKELSTFLWTRGLWLVILELTVMHFAYDFDLSRHEPLLLLVLWGLGLCMLVLAALVWLPERAILFICIAVIVLHNCLDGIRPDAFGSFAPLWNLLHVPGPFGALGTTMILGYPLVPWVAVMGLGFCAGRFFLMEPSARRRTFLILGIVSTLAFVVIRALNGYGDPAPWSTQSTPSYSLLSFLNTTKYPPSLSFLMMTAGPLLLAFVAFDWFELKPTNPLVVFGRVPLFYFIAHFFAAHIVVVVLGWLRYGTPSFAFIFHRVPSMGGPAELFPPGFGYSLWVVYGVWAALVVALYPLCRWYAAYKGSRTNWFLRYI